MESALCPPADPSFRLIETFRWEPGAGILHRASHMARLARSAARLGIRPRGVDTALAELSGDSPLRVRLTVDANGQAGVTSAPFTPLAHGTIWRVAIADKLLRSDDPWLQVKTTQRAQYDTARAHLPDGVDELLFCNERGELCEGTITNLFVRVDDQLLTPPLSSGLLPGVLRQEMLDSGEAIEAVLTPAALQRATQLFVGNSLRGLIPASLAGKGPGG